MTGSEAGRVVIGVPDGTAAQIDVLLDAAAELYRQRGTHTTLLHAVGAAFDLRPPTAVSIAERRHRAEDLLHAAARRLVNRVGYPARIEIIVSTERPATELVNQSQTAALLVVLRGRTSRHDHLRIGSVSSMVGARSACPVLVLPDDHRPASGAPVVVGVSSAGSSAPAVDAAFAEASWRGCDVVAVHAWTQPDPVLWDQASQSAQGGVAAYPDLLHATRQRAVVTLSEALAGQAGRFPEVVVRQVLDTADPVEAMTRAAEHACMVVVGRHRRATHGTIGLGAVGRSLLRHADVPILIAPTPTPAGEHLTDVFSPTPGVPVLPVMTGLAPRW